MRKRKRFDWRYYSSRVRKKVSQSTGRVCAEFVFAEQELDGDEVSVENFPLPTLAPRLVAASEEIYNGLGAVILRGLDVDQFSAADLATVFLGVSSYIAPKRGIQDRNGTMISK